MHAVLNVFLSHQTGNISQKLPGTHSALLFVQFEEKVRPLACFDVLNHMP